MSSSGSMMLLEEYFSREDERFQALLREIGSPRALGAFADRWKRDPRPWSRRQLLAYLDLPWSCAGHQPVIRRVFKHVEATRDNELMAAFLVGFDRLVRRVRVKRFEWDAELREAVPVERLNVPRNTLPAELRGRIRSPLTGRQISVPESRQERGRLFKYRSRYYLRRRAWRYYRRMGFQHPGEYVHAVAAALERYANDDLAKGEHILDSWGLMQACFRYHPALKFGASRIRLKPGRRLSELTPAPRFPQLWRDARAFPTLLRLVTQARSHLVRVWAIELVRWEHRERLAALEPDALLPLFDHPDPDVQAFGVAAFETCGRLASLPLETWLRLLDAQNLTLLETVCQAMQRHVTPDRLTLGECVELACREPTPVARLGFDWLQTKPVVAIEDREIVSQLSRSQCAALGRELAAWGLARVAAANVYDRDLAIRFFDTPQAEVRHGAWDQLRPETPAYDDAVIWSRLLESPYDDLRLKLIDALAVRSTAPRPSADSLAPLWCTVLLGVHRGGRQKLKAIRQVADAIGADSSRLPALLPVLAAALRSVRQPEFREALSAVTTLATQHPELAADIARLLPELRLLP